MKSISKHQQRGKVSGALLILVGDILILWVSWDLSPAPAADVKAVVEMVNEVPAARIKVQTFLANNPSPNNVELKNLKRDINDLVVLEEAKKITGNPDLKSSSEQQAETDAVMAAMQQSQRQEIAAKKSSELSMTEWIAYIGFYAFDHWQYALIPIWLFFVLFGWIKIKHYSSGLNH